VALKEARLGVLREHQKFCFSKGDIADRSAIDRLFEEHRPSRVIHLAAQPGVRYSLENPRAYVESNLVAFANLLECCRHTPAAAQAKLVRALRGALFDVAVDLRRGSPTFSRWCSARLSAAGGEQIFIPQGFAHGFCTLEPDTEVAYKIDAYYRPECEGGVAWDDPQIAIPWPVAPAEAILSERDRKLPRLSDLDSPFTL
jgi:dTDP-4-dehydrorhamnose 3,5-epimerase